MCAMGPVPVFRNMHFESRILTYNIIKNEMEDMGQTQSLVKAAVKLNICYLMSAHTISTQICTNRLLSPSL
jgi:hypothetical protein